MKKVVFYGLSTCGWCKRTKQFLDKHNVEYDLHYVDLLSGQKRQQVLEEVKRWNPRTSFPTVVVDDETVVVGYREDELKEVLGL